MFMPQALAKSINQVARQAAGKDWNLYASLLEHWQEIVGNDYARMTTPVKVVFPPQPNEAQRRNGVLCIRLPKGLAMEFSFKSEIIRQKINAYFGYDAIARITFDPVYDVPGQSTAPVAADPAAMAHLRETTQTVEDDTLRGALESFGEAVLARQATETAGSKLSKPR